MTQLTTLGLAYVMEAHEKELCSSIGKMEHLRHLHLYASSGLIKTDALSSAPPYLEKLFLNGKLEKVPHWFNGLHSLTYLTMRGSQLGEDLLSHIQALPNLSYFSLGDNAYNQERLCFLEGFQKLRFLRILCFDVLNEVVIEKDVMPYLRELEVNRCKELRGLLPYGLDHLTHLKKVNLCDVLDKLVERVCREMNISHCPTTQGILLNRADEAECKWFHKFIY